MKAFFLTTFILLCASASRGQVAATTPSPEPAESAHRSFTAECEMIVVPAKLAIPLIPEMLNDAKISAALERIRGMIARDELKLAAHLVGQGLEKQKTAIDSAEELSYATEFDPPQTPATLPNAPPLTLEMLKNWPIVGITPTTFTSRRVGQTLGLEVNPTADEKAVLCNVVVHDVRLERYTKTDAGRLANGEHLFVEQPVFSDMSNNAQILLQAGRPKLIGVHRLVGVNEGMFEFFVLTVALEPKLP